MIETSRRRFLHFGLIGLAAPAIVRVASLMPVRTPNLVTPQIVIHDYGGVSYRFQFSADQKHWIDWHNGDSGNHRYWRVVAMPPPALMKKIETAVVDCMTYGSTVVQFT